MAQVIHVNAATQQQHNKVKTSPRSASSLLRAQVALDLGGPRGRGDGERERTRRRPSAVGYSVAGCPHLHRAQTCAYLHIRNRHRPRLKRRQVSAAGPGADSPCPAMGPRLVAPSSTGAKAQALLRCESSMQKRYRGIRPRPPHEGLAVKAGIEH